MKKEKDEYIEKLSKKDPMFMNFTELQDWLDYIIYDKMKYHTFNAVQRDTFEHLLVYFRLNQFALHLIMAKAEMNQYFIRSLMLLLKESNPELVDTIFEMVENMKKEYEQELLKNESPMNREIIRKRVKELEEKMKQQKNKDVIKENE